MIGSLQLPHRSRKVVPQAKQYFDRNEVHIGSSVVPGVQHLGQNFNAPVASIGVCLTTASRYSWGMPNAAANPDLPFWLRDFQEIKYTANKNDNHYEGGEGKGCC
jgi:hypothetical protein